MKKIFYDHLTWPEIKEMWDDNKVVVQLIGAIEQHGPHLPLCTDIAPKVECARRAITKASEKIKVFMAPPVPWGYSTLQMDIPGEVDRYPGSLTLTPELLMNLVCTLCDGFIRANFRKILLLNCHGGNYQPLQTAARMIRDKHGSKALVAVTNYAGLPDTQKLMDILEEKTLKHAAEWETSLVLGTLEELVDKSRIKKDPAAMQAVKVKTRYASRDELGGKAFAAKVMVAEKNVDFSSQGVAGDATLASKEKGDRIVNLMVDSLVDLLLEFSTWEYGKM
jgi:creatinine amidohydrolase